MPELPEVETVRNTLKKQLLGEKIINVEIYYDKMFYPNKDDFRNLINQTFKDIKRYGKYLFFIFDDYIVISHLRMEGKFFIKTNQPVNKHEHIVFTLNSNRTLRYHDTRKFGTMKLLKTSDYQLALQEPEIKKLGQEANDPNLTKEILYQKLSKQNVPIKTALLNQENICGLGNIYVDEVLFLSNIHPLTKAKNLTLEETEKIVNNAKIVLEKAIQAGGTTIRSYTSSLGVTGLFQLELFVHTKVGQKCQKCNSIIQKITVGGRGTYYCPSCQIKKPNIIGITGGIAAGKSAVLTYLKNTYQTNDYLFIDADVISHNLLQEKAVIDKLIDSFGDEVCENGQINRKTLGKIVFSEDEKRLTLNKIIHPLVRSKIIKTINQNQDKQIIFVDVPLLIETNMTDLTDEVWFVYVPKNVQLERLMKRDEITQEEALKRINAQMDIDEKLNSVEKLTNKLIINNQNKLEETYQIINQEMNRRLKKCL